MSFLIIRLLSFVRQCCSIVARANHIPEKHTAVSINGNSNAGGICPLSPSFVLSLPGVKWTGAGSPKRDRVQHAPGTFYSAH